MRVVFTLCISFLLITGLFAQDTIGSKGLGHISTTSTNLLNGGKNYALIIGVSNYMDGKKIPQLKYAHTDAENFYNLLVKGYEGKIAGKDIKTYFQKDATYANINAAIGIWLEDLIPQLKRGDVLYIFYSGHGITTNESNSQKLLCYDSKINDSALSELSSAIRLKTLKNTLEDITGKEKGVTVVLITDACRKSESDLLQTAISFNNASRNEDLDGENEFLFYSSDNNKYSYETDHLKSGIFSYFLSLGLMGAADDNNDNKVSVFELSEFVRENVKNYTNRILRIPNGQIPQSKYTEHNENLIISSPPVDTVLFYKKVYDSVNALVRKGIGINNISGTEYASKGFHPGTGYVPSNEEFYQAISRVNNEFANNYPDSSEELLYNKMIEAIQQKLLIAPENSSAFSYYTRLKEIPANPGILSLAKEKLFAALIGEPQKLIDDYLGGHLRKTTKDTFYLAYRELNKAAELISSKNNLQQDLKPKLFFLEARALASSTDPNEWKTGLRLIDSAIKADPGVPYNYHTKALLQSNQSNHFKALENFKKAAELAPHWAYPVYGLAEKYYDIGEYGKSIFYCREAIRKDSSYALSYYLIGLNYENVKMYDSAIYYYKTALKIDSTVTSAIYRLGLMAEILVKENTGIVMNEPEVYFRAGMKKYGDIPCILALGYIQNQKNNLDSAAYYYTAALRKDSFNLGAIEDLAYLWGNNKKLGSADSLYKRALKRFGFDAGLYGDFAYFCFQYYSPTMGDSLYSIAKIINPEDPANYINQSYLWETKQNDYKKAASFLQEGLKQIKKSAKLNYVLAQFYFKRRMDSVLATVALDSALYYYTISKQLAPEYSKTLLGIYSVYKEKKMYDSALHYLEQACIQNKYIRNDISGAELFSMSMDAIRQNQLDIAIKILQSDFINLGNNMPAMYSLANCYYLRGNFDTTLQLLGKIEIDKADLATRINLLELKALSFFDKKQYDKALMIFRDLDENVKVIPDFLGQAVCSYLLGKNAEAKQLLSQTNSEFPNLISGILSADQRKYSPNFLFQLKLLLKNE